MSRLIRDTDLLAVIETWKKDLFPNDDVEDVAVYNVLCRMEDIINDTDEAYSAKAVVRELEAKSTVAAQKTFEAAEMGFERASIHYQGIQDGLDYAIEIVRGGRNE